MALPAQQPLALSKYEILEEIGHGGMATVYRAKDRRLGREVAVKVIHRHLQENPEVATRFQSEALAVAKVKHPNIVEVYDVSGEDEAEKYLVVELIRGITLRQLLRERGPAPPEIAACIAVEITRALALAHREGVVHRDIKPENVLLSIDPAPSSQRGGETARVKLTDFGIAKLLDAQGVTHTGQVLGSPAHMAPEQIEGGDVDARADVFGVGVLLYELLTGSLPFEGSNPAQVLRKVLEGVFLPAERQRPRVGSAYGEIVQKALARAPIDRFSSATELGEALESELAAVGITEVRAEIASYLDNEKGYVSEHEAHLPEVLSESATAARAQGNIVRAAALFNRALAYRPDDTQLLAEVAGLARRDRFRRRMASALVVGTSLLLLAGAAFWILKGRPESDKVAQVENQAAEKPPSTPVAKAPAVAPAVEKPEEPPPVATVPAPPEQPTGPAVQPRKKPRAPALARPPRTVPKGTRPVKTTVVQGPQNAVLRIDGRETSWFELHNLTYGPHTFEFVAPNRVCCEASPPRTIEIVPGEGTQLVQGVIRFRSAVLRLDAPAGTTASCGLGLMKAGDSRSIPMERSERPLKCTIFPPANTGRQSKQIDVRLSPGRTFTLTGT